MTLIQKKTNKAVVEFLKWNPHVGFFALFVVAGIGWGIVSLYKRDRQAADFIRREINGVLIKVRDDHHGEYTIAIRQSGSNQILEYYLFISSFVRNNNIQESDSISKLANGHTINFYKKKNGKFHKCCDIYYY
jgi:hypothetical protein